MFDTIAVSPDQMSVAGSSDECSYTGRPHPEWLADPPAGRHHHDVVVGRRGRSMGCRAGRRPGAGVVADQGARPVPVSAPKPLGPVTALRVAPDGVRVALVTGSGSGARLWLAAIVRSGNHATIGNPVPIGTDIADFTALTWYDTGDVIALTQPPSGSELYEVPVDGGPSRPIATESGTVSIAASAACGELCGCPQRPYADATAGSEWIDLAACGFGPVRGSRSGAGLPRLICGENFCTRVIDHGDISACPPDIPSRRVTVLHMAPARVRGCAGQGPP